MTSPPRLLVVDDSSPMRQVICELASELGYEVAGEAADGHAGVAAALTLAPDVVVMDWRLPGMDGVAATRAIRERRPRTTVIAASSAEARDIASLFLDAGAAAFVDKRDAGSLIAELRRAGMDATVSTATGGRRAA